LREKEEAIIGTRQRNSSTVAAAGLTCSALGIRAGRFFNAQL